MQLRTQERKERIELAQQQTLVYTTLTLAESAKFLITYYLLQVQRYVGTLMSNNFSKISAIALYVSRPIQFWNIYPLLTGTTWVPMGYAELFLMLNVQSFMLEKYK